MPTSTEFPVLALAESWFRMERTPSPFQLPFLSRQLLLAARRQIRLRMKAKETYNPFNDRVYLWASQWLNRVATPGYQIDPALHNYVATVSFSHEPFLSNQLLAAHDDTTL
ncbi:MAG: hypothetical protein EOP85_15890 [Verrucomicrobiaceae bacterium]|nr:MAG: hypothetical protein EOP85_15890 [Verrucomicrobiaceae bacterium]